MNTSRLISVVLLGTCVAGPAAAAPPFTLVSFSWSSSGSVDGYAATSCSPGCGSSSGCTTPNFYSFLDSGAVLQSTLVDRQANRNCYGLCADAAIAISQTQTNGSVVLNDPVVASDLAQVSFRGDLNVQASCGAGALCGVGFAGSSGQSAQFFDLVFDIGPGPATLSIYHEQSVSSGGTATSHWFLERGGQTYLEFTLSAATGGGTNNGFASRRLPAGHYHFRIDAAAADSISFSAEGGGAQFGGASVQTACGFSFEPYNCIADFDFDGAVTVGDIFSMLAAWFAGDPATDFNSSGGQDVGDIFAFLALWFSPGC